MSLSTAARILAQPTWSLRSLLPPTAAAVTSTSTSTSPTSPTSPTPPTIGDAQLDHLLRLSALRVPAAPGDRQRLRQSLHEHLHFVQMVCRAREIGSSPSTPDHHRRRRDDDVEPLAAIRDERVPPSVRLADLQDLLAAEHRPGYYGRPRRTRGGGQAESKITMMAKKTDPQSDQARGAETADGAPWDPLSHAAKRLGRLIVANVPSTSPSSSSSTSTSPSQSPGSATPSGPPSP